jgi:hypothetical protein
LKMYVYLFVIYRFLLVVEYTCKITWNSHFNNPESITQLIISCTLLRTLFTSSSQLDDIMRKTTDLCYKMHVHRLCLLDDVIREPSPSTTPSHLLLLLYSVFPAKHGTPRSSESCRYITFKTD